MKHISISLLAMAAIMTSLFTSCNNGENGNEPSNPSKNVGTALAFAISPELYNAVDIVVEAKTPKADLGQLPLTWADRETDDFFCNSFFNTLNGAMVAHYVMPTLQTGDTVWVNTKLTKKAGYNSNENIVVGYGQTLLTKETGSTYKGGIVYSKKTISSDNLDTYLAARSKQYFYVVP